MLHNQVYVISQGNSSILKNLISMNCVHIDLNQYVYIYFSSFYRRLDHENQDEFIIKLIHFIQNLFNFLFHWLHFEDFIG